MDLVSALKVTLRRWKIAAAVLIVTAVAAIAAFFTADTIYTAENYVVVVPNSVTELPNFGESGQVSQVDQAQRSALVSAGGARLVSNLLVTNLNSAEQQRQLGAGDSAGYGATADPQLPVVTITATGTDEAAVAALLGRTIDSSDRVLADLQGRAGIPPSSAYRAPRFAPDPVVSSATPDRNKVVGAIAVAGVVLAVLLAVALDGPLSRRERERERDGEGEASNEPVEAPSDQGSHRAPVQGAAFGAPGAPESPGSDQQQLSQPQPYGRQGAGPPSPAVDARTERLQQPRSRSVNADR